MKNPASGATRGLFEITIGRKPKVSTPNYSSNDPFRKPWGDATLEGAWRAMREGIEHHEPEIVSFTAYRQAFKNGAAMVLARVLHRGLTVEAVPLMGDEEGLAALSVGAAVLVMSAHPEWGDTHGDCVLAGAVAMQTLFRACHYSANEAQRQVENFEVAR